VCLAPGPTSARTTANDGLSGSNKNDGGIMFDKHYLTAGNAIPLSTGGLSAILDVRSNRAQIRIIAYVSRYQILDLYSIADAHFRAHRGGPAKWQLPDFFDGAPQLTCIKSPSLRAPRFVPRLSRPRELPGWLLRCCFSLVILRLASSREKRVFPSRRWRSRFHHNVEHA
jgi:hypothetical protein